MEKRDLDLTNYNESVGWRKLFKINSKYITSESRLKKKLSIVLPYKGSTIFPIGNDGYWLIEIFGLGRSILIDPKGTYTELHNLKIVGVTPHKHKFIVLDKNESILILDGDSKALANTGRNYRNTQIILLSDYGEFVYIENNKLNIPDRNISIPLCYLDYDKYTIYCGRDYYSLKVSDIFISCPFDNEKNTVENSIVYKDELLYNDASHSINAINRYYNYRNGAGAKMKIIEIYDNTNNTLDEIIDMSHIAKELLHIRLDSNGTSIINIYYNSIDDNVVMEIFGP